MTDRWNDWLEHAARIAWRGHGGAEPNPMVGCVILDAGGTLAGEGYHRRCGGAHAEVEALARAGERARGGTAVVTLEPCNHHGRTGPCTLALHRAGIARVVYACTDPSTDAAGGASRLRELGVQTLHVPSRAAELVTAPFLHRTRTPLPWVTLKWAQSLDGLIARPQGDSRWISGERSRAMVHRERGRVDAILTGMGTVLADNPLLTARGVTIRRRAVRVVWDPRLELPLACNLVRTALEVPLIVGAPEQAIADHATHAQRLADAGVHVVPAGNVRALLAWLRAQRDVSTVLVEAGSGLMGQLLADGLANEAWVFVAPILIGDDSMPGPVRPHDAAHRPVAQGFELISVRRRGDDVLVHYRMA